MQQIKYYARDFESIKTQLISFIKQHYGDVYSDYSESSVAMMLLELNAIVGDNLSYHLDRTYNELFLDTAQNKDSIIKLAKNLGYKPRNKRASSCLVDVSIVVPTDFNIYDVDYLLAFKSYMCLSTNTKDTTYFEIPETIDFASECDINGVINRTVTPVYASDNSVAGYKITKRVVALAGRTMVEDYVIQSNDVQPFWQYKINRDDVIEIVRVIDDQVDIPDDETWLNDSLNWYEVSSLSDNKLFLPADPNSLSTVQIGSWKEVTKRFVVDYDKDGYPVLTFGSGAQNFDLYSSWLAGVQTLNLSQFLNNNALGVIPTLGQHLHFKYRVGGGLSSNVAANSVVNVVERKLLTDIATFDSILINTVLSSLSVNNPIPAIGGSEPESVEEIRHNARSWFAAQDRCVTLQDYIARSMSMPAKYGTIFRVHGEHDAVGGYKIKLYVLTVDENGHLSLEDQNDLILHNLSEYLSYYRQVGDFVEIHAGDVINVGIDFTIHIDPAHNRKEIVAQCILKLKDYFVINRWQMNQPIYITQLIDLLHNVYGVLSVANINFVNIYGTSGNYQYSNARIDSVYLDGDIIKPVNNVIYGTPTSMFEVRYPNKDIVGRVV